MKPISFIFFILLGFTFAFNVENQFKISDFASASVAQVGDYLYFGTENAIIEFDTKTDQETRRLDTSMELGFSSMVYIDEDDDQPYIIFGGYGEALRLQPSTMNVMEAVDLEDSINVVLEYEYNAYFAGYCLWKAPVFYIAALDIECGAETGDFGLLKGFVYGDSLYYTASKPGTIFKYDPTDLSYVEINNLHDHWLFAATAVGDYAYLGSWDSSTLLKFNLLTETVDASINLASISYASTVFAVGNYLYVGDNHLTRVSLADFTESKTLTLPGAQLFDYEIVGTHAYFASYDQSPFVWKVNINTDCDYRGNTVLDGDSLTVYSSKKICSTTNCDSVKGSVTCKAGKLTGDITFGFTSCIPWGGCECLDNLGNHYLYAGQPKTVYKRPGACGETTCEDLKGTVTCHNGEVTGDTDYLFDSCDGTACPCEDAPGGLLHSGESRSVARMVDGETVKNEVYCYDTVLYRQEYPNLPVDIPRK